MMIVGGRAQILNCHRFQTFHELINIQLYLISRQYLCGKSLKPMTIQYSLAAAGVLTDVRSVGVGLG